MPWSWPPRILSVSGISNGGKSELPWPDAPNQTDPRQFLPSKFFNIPDLPSDLHLFLYASATLVLCNYFADLGRAVHGESLSAVFLAWLVFLAWVFERGFTARFSDLRVLSECF